MQDDCAKQMHPIDTSFLQSHLQLNSSVTGGGGRDQTPLPLGKGTAAKSILPIFVLGLCLVAAEGIFNIDKAAVMMLTAGVLWILVAVSQDFFFQRRHPAQTERSIERQTKKEQIESRDALLDTAETVLFLLPAMAIVEIMSHFDGFAPIASVVSSDRKKLMLITFFITFVLSSVIDNLTSTIVVLKLLKTLLPDDKEFRKQCGAVAVITSNAGGAWSPIGDLTTTMLWVGDKISVGPTMRWLLLPSVTCGIFPLAGLMWQARLSSDDDKEHPGENAGEREGVFVSYQEVGVLILGCVCILMVPVLKEGYGVPPYLGMISALGFFWLVIELLGLKSKESGDSDVELHGVPQRAVTTALKKVELPCVFFITGMLLAVGALNAARILDDVASFLETITGGSPVSLSILLGLSSAVVDNVPLVDAATDMFATEGKDSPLWQLVALCAGTGGSILPTGSMAGVMLMGMEDVSLMWYCRHASVWAALGFFLGIGVYQIELNLFG